MSIFTELIKVAALLISLSYVYGRLYRIISRFPGRRRQIGIGVLFAAMGMISMLMPLELSPGVIIDARVIIVAFAALFGGIVSSLITASACLVLRFFIGGPGIFPGFATLLMAVILGYALRMVYFRKKGMTSMGHHLIFALTGTASAFIFLFCMLLLPADQNVLSMIEQTAIPITLIFTVLAYLTGLLIKREQEQYQVEQELKTTIERKRKALAVANDGYFEWDLRTGKIYLDTNYLQLAGYESGDFEGNREEWIARVHRDDFPQVEKALNDFIEGRCPSYDESYRFRTKEGLWMWIHARAVALEKDEDGRVLRLLGTHSDISSYKEAQLELKRLQSAIEYAAESILITDVNGTIQYINPAFSRITGYNRDEALGKKTNILKSGEHDDVFYRNLWKTIKEGKSWSGQIKNRKKDGSQYIVETVISPVFGEKNRNIVNYVSIKRDITGDINLQEQVEQSRKMQAIGQLAGGVAHDFNNMLTGIMTATLMLRKKMSHDELSMKYLSIIDEAVNRSAELTKNLLSFSRKQPQLLNIINLHDSIGRTVKLLDSTLDKSISLNIDLCDVESSIVGDSAQIENAILNLCINASHAIEDRGEIGIMTEVVDFDLERCEREPFDLEPGRYIHLAVSDSGKGMEPELQSKIFEPFFTTKAKTKGTGLGLTAVYAMIQQHRGSIHVESAPGAGTVFHLHFFLIEDEEDVIESQVRKNYEGEGTILLVDDEKLIHAPLEDMLTDSGYQVYVAENGLEALDIFRDHWRTIDLVILDVIMPKMDGLNCLKGLREINPSVPVIVETGYSSEEKINRMKEIGIQGMIRKPAPEELISRTISDVLCG